MANLGNISRLAGSPLTLDITFTYRGEARTVYAECSLSSGGTVKVSQGTVPVQTSVDARQYTLTIPVATSGLPTAWYAAFVSVWPDLAAKNSTGDAGRVWYNGTTGGGASGTQQAIGQVSILSGEFSNWGVGQR